MKKSTRFLCTIMMVVMLMTGVPFSAPTVLKAEAAQAALVTRDEAVQWAKNHANNRTPFDIDGIYGIQCSDFGTSYINWLISGKTTLNSPFTTYNGYKYFDLNYPDSWTKIVNTPSFVPEPGDILVWGQV